MPDESALTITQLVGRNLRRLRQDRGKVIQDLVDAARALGIDWPSPTISRTETGQRDLSLEEILALPKVVSLATGELITLADLLSCSIDEEIDRALGLGQIAYALAAPLAARLGQDSGVGRQILEVVREDLKREVREAQLRRDQSENLTAAAEIATLARELGVDRSDLLDAFRDLWGRRLSRERDRRLVESGADLGNPGRVRALRGHLTRELKAELREHFFPSGSLSGEQVTGDPADYLAAAQAELRTAAQAESNRIG